MSRENHHAGLHLAPRHYKTYGKNQDRSCDMEPFDRYAYLLATSKTTKKDIPLTDYSREICRSRNTKGISYSSKRGERVYHKKYGTGTIIDKKETSICIRFDDDDAQRLFAFPFCYESGIVAPYHT